MAITKSEPTPGHLPVRCSLEDRGRAVRVLVDHAQDLVAPLGRDGHAQTQVVARHLARVLRQEAEQVHTGQHRGDVLGEDEGDEMGTEVR